MASRRRLIVGASVVALVGCGTILADSGGASDRPVGNDASSAPFCSGVDASLCTSFDDDSVGFDVPGFKALIENGAMSYTTDRPRSPPRSLDVSLFDHDAGVVALHHYREDAGRHVRCAFDVRIDIPGTADAYIVQVSDPTWVSLGRIVVTKEGDFALEKIQSNGPSPRLPIRKIEVGVWAHVTMEVDGTPALVATIEGASASAPLSPADAGENIPLITDLHVGLGAFTVPSYWRASFDDVYCSGL